MSVKDSQELKGLQTRLTKALQNHKQLKSESLDIDKEINNTVTRMNVLHAQIEKIKARNKDILVTEHAILRYVERCMGFDLDQIRNEILTDSLKTQIKSLGDGKYPVAEGCRAIVKNNTIITIS